jgi:hypothetical protein
VELARELLGLELQHMWLGKHLGWFRRALGHGRGRGHGVAVGGESSEFDAYGGSSPSSSSSNNHGSHSGSLGSSSHGGGRRGQGEDAALLLWRAAAARGHADAQLAVATHLASPAFLGQAKAAALPSDRDEEFSSSSSSTTKESTGGGEVALAFALPRGSNLCVCVCARV